MGYMSDGFIRPDDELVYTTSASDEVGNSRETKARMCGVGN